MECDEIAVYTAIVKWTNENVQERKVYFETLFSFLDLQLFTDTFLAENVAKEVIQLS